MQSEHIVFMSKKVLFITIEAPDYAGKTTQSRMLDTWLTQHGVDFIHTHEPGGTPRAELVRQALLDIQKDKPMSPVAEAYLYAASRAIHVSEIIKPALSKSKLVISDRYLDSSLAYQGFARELGEDFVKDLNRSAIDGVLPEYTFFLDADPAFLANRKQSRDNLDRLEMEGTDFQTKCRLGFLKIISNNPDRFWVIDATLPPEEVFSHILLKLEPILRERGFI